ncbi:hypothetical protein ASD46_23375 [Rhizobium sp. Root491]|uniref:nucleotidyltransferase domain-containing protein n=1 Tax=Rhizobium sp. Root491 TaxID=1736548 RepID=UPI000713C656|nr:nucleotidyltransferase domain-containing protein [Rhizobium sp. Root491]KQY50744.1 hypothetical protein ASD46_23375 [Rhizobium sp. Root491]
MASTLPQAHACFLQHVCEATASDERMIALLIGGSYIHGGFDEHSDLDFVVVVKNESYEDVMASRLAFAESLPNFVNAFTGEHVGEPRLLICLYGPPLLHVDLKFVLMSDFDKQIERRAVLFARKPEEIEALILSAEPVWPNLPAQWFEERAWIWLHYAVTKLLRGELYEAIGMLAFFREQILGPLIYRRAGKNQRGVRRLEALGPDLHGRLVDTIASYDATAVRDAIEASIDIYLNLRADDPLFTATRQMPELLRDLIGQGSPRAVGGQ